MKKEFTVLTISRSFLEECGFEAAAFDDEMMETIASDLGNYYLSNAIDEDLEQVIHGDDE